MGLLKYKGYTGTVDYSEEDNCLYGKVKGLHGILISYEGNTVDEIKSDFECAIDDYLASCEARGVAPAKPYSGRLVLRMPSELHCRVADAALSSGTTINDFINTAVTRQLGATSHASV